MPEERKQFLKENYGKQNEREDPADLPGWVKVALIRYELYGYTWQEVAKLAGRSYNSLQKFKKSPAAKKWREITRERLQDPDFIAESLLRAETLGASLDYIWAMDRARELGDYKEVRLAAKDLLASEGLLKTHQSQKPTIDAGSITINLQLPPGINQLEPVVIESEHEILQLGEGDVEVLDE